MTATCVVRPARPEEHAQIAELTRAAYAEYGQIMAPTAWSALAAAVETALATKERVERIVAIQNGQMAGSVMLYNAGSDAYAGQIEQANVPEVRMLAVHPSARGQGISEALMHECVRRARAAGAAQIGLHTSASMRAAIALYQRMGFTRAPAFDFQPLGAELITAYRLDLAHDAKSDSGSH
ncbi:MAG: GNAT family N-acetyltransferase [Gemmatimonadota bacterium]